MHILITGGSGFLGTALIQRLLHDQHSITVTSRQPEQFPLSHPLLTVTTLKKLESIGYADIVINLAGAGIADKRWTEQRKTDLLQSRLQTTQALINWFKQLAVKPQQFLSGSAIGWYGSHDNNVLNETSKAQAGFTHALCQQWEQCALQAQELGISTTLLRTGVVLDQSGGMIARLKPIYQLGFGGRIGSGQQWMSWISREDWINAVLFLMQHPIAGPVNLVAPTPVTQAQFARDFAQALHRPAWLPMPTFMAKLAFGEMSHLFLDSQRIMPECLIQAGFNFQHPDVSKALSQLVQ
ncbi:TIGR01777 family oxidoreductase [Alkanindiges illinoisensis]|uniref:TIGR01777 family oxidoreductase n=1 Tax=Alkanindiges illinoisensis TaxID=197183 RepID=UPI0004786C6A|nr:TIGR01777 family oxidoreductase [Alkanindiges illinoisensis]